MKCLYPIKIRGDDDINLRDRNVPCGRCYACKANKRLEWCMRLKAELLSSKISLFCTMTYDDEHLPVGDFVDERTGEFVRKPYPDKTDIQLFLKRLRKHYGEHFRYFCTSEYGDLTKRPHWHMLLFTDYDLLPYDFYDTFVSKWAKGNCMFGNVEDASINYVTKYVLKESSLPFGLDDTKRLSSRRPAIGYDLIMKQLKLYNIPNATFDNFMLYGQSGMIPRLFRDKMLNLLSPEVAEDLKFDMLMRSKKKLLDDFNKSGIKDFYTFMGHIRSSYDRKEQILKSHLKPHIKV